MGVWEPPTGDPEADPVHRPHRKPRPGEVVDQGFLDVDGGWRYRTKIQGADSSFRYEVFVERVSDGVRCAGCVHRAHRGPCGAVVIIDGCPCLTSTAPLWDRVGSELAAFRWSARWAARKLRRRHVRRFGR